jgi:hypothetical protein
MPKQIDPDAALSETRRETTFTRAALRAHPDAADLVDQTADWNEPISDLRSELEANEDERTELDAQFKVLNAGFDADCIAFGEDALKAAGKDRSNPRFTRYFKVAPNEFVRQDIDDQVAAVEGWLSVDDPTLAPWRARFEAWLLKLKAHRTARVASTQKTQTLRIKRQAFATDLTAKRDALHRRLGDRAQERGLPRGFADLFFRQG